MMRTKKGVSPVIATVLLIAIVVALAVIVFVSIKGLIGESITKFNGENVKLVCNKVKFEASYSNGVLAISNSGDTPIYKIKIKASGKGNSNSAILIDQWKKNGLVPGGTYSGEVPSNIQSKAYDTLTLIPILLGKTNGGQATYPCDSNGYKISINK